ncbi:MAG TPA: hypothetical protein VK166_17575 [Chitinophagaceae bacterium]|nr:hypothetical protein [Chitinophagaceae bacterium]
MIRLLSIILLIFCTSKVHAQFSADAIKTNYVLQSQRDNLKKNLYNYTIQQSFALPLNKETEYRYQSAFWAISQFIIFNDLVRTGFNKTLAAYHDSLEVETRRAFLEAMYAVAPASYLQGMKKIMALEKHPKLQAMIMLWVLKADPKSLPEIRIIAEEKYRADSTNKILQALKLYVENYGKPEMVPSIHDLFAHQQSHMQKVVYSFQNRNRDYPGIAVIQKQDGSFERDEQGKLLAFGQLARSASSMPYFITNGNTPQGIYSITGTASSSNNFIGPTPNLQMILPFEYYWVDFFHTEADTTDPLLAYDALLPASWKNFRGAHESFRAGEIGRTEIIAHGTTIDPEYFSNKPYYPYSPTLGCLCSAEIWDSSTGMIRESEQLRLVNGFLRSPGSTGFLIVIDYFSQNRALTAADIEPFIKSFEQKYKR